jgi:hypothetical protein
MDHVYQFYGDLMGSPRETRVFSVDPVLWPEENDALGLMFSPEKLEAVLESMKPDSAPGLDGFPVTFFKRFCGTLKGPVLQIIDDFGFGRINIARLNYDTIPLIPEVKGADQIKLFRRIALINVIFKFIVKAYAMRLAPLAHMTIDCSQTTFIKGRCLHKGVLALHEIAQELRVNKLDRGPAP